MFATRLSQTYDYYLEAANVKSFQDMKQAVVLEQFLSTLDPLLNNLCDITVRRQQKRRVNSVICIMRRNLVHVSHVRMVAQ